MTAPPASTRLRLLCGIVWRFLFAGFCLYSALNRETNADDWPQWRGPNRDGVWHETGIMEAFPVEGLRTSWRVPIGEGWSSPVVAKGKVYVTDVEEPKVAERIVCFDATDGKLLWSQRWPVKYPVWALGPDGGGPRSTPIVHDGRVYALGAMGDLFCLDAGSGETLWAKTLAEEYDVKEFTGITASPLIEGDLLIFYICGKPAATVIALERKTGKEAWRSLDDTFTYSSPVVLSAGGKRQLIVWTQEAITSLDPSTGKTWWREVIRTPGDQAIATPVFAGHHLLIGGLMLELAADRPAAVIVWPESKAASQRVLSNTSTPIILGDHIYSAKTSGELVCLETATGKEAWQTDKVTSLKNGAAIHLSPNGGSVLLYTDQGNLIRAHLRPEGYQEISRTHLLDPTYAFGGRNVTWSPPAYSDKHIFVRNEKELICASLDGTP